MSHRLDAIHPRTRREDPSKFYVCSACDAVVVDPHIHNLWEFAHPLQVEQHSTAGLDLEPTTFTIIVVYGAWIDMSMDCFYHSKHVRIPRVGLS